MKQSSPKNKASRFPRRGYSGRGRYKSFFIWGLILVALLSLVFYPSVREEAWTIKQVLDATLEGRVIKGTIESVPSKGIEWYKVSVTVKNPEYDLQGHISEEVVPATRVFLAEGRLTEDAFQMLQSSGDFVEKPTSKLAAELFFSLLPVLLIIGLVYVLFVRQLRNAGRGALSFARSKAKLLNRERAKVAFKDVAGCDEAKEEVSEIVDFLKDPKKFQKIGGRVPKGVLMVGPPGTGKTLLAKAVAGEANVPFFSISGSDFVEMFVGVGAARVRDMFEQARKHSPCIVFIDEIDAVGRQRGAGLGGGNDEREQTLNSLLVEMDGFEGHEGIIIIAATNRPDVLDNALLRPGRFDRQVMIDLPDLHGRKEILDIHAKKVKLAEDADLQMLARNTSGFSGADLANVLNEAALLAARYGKGKVSSIHIEQARDKIAYGHERRRLMDDEDKRVTAYHEGGHALVQAVIDDGHLPIHKVTIIPRGLSLGSTMFVPKKDILNQSKQRVLNQICCAMGGRIAESLVFGDITSGAAGDIKMATQLARKMVCEWGMSLLGPLAYGQNEEHLFLGKEINRTQNYSEHTAQQIDREIQRTVEVQYQRAEAILKEKRQVLDNVAQALLQYETIEGKHVHEILDHGEIRSPVVAPLRPSFVDKTSIKRGPSLTPSKTGENLGGPETVAAGASV